MAAFVPGAGTNTICTPEKCCHYCDGICFGGADGLVDQEGLCANGEESVHDGVPAGVYVRVVFASHARTIRISVRSVGNYFGDFAKTHTIKKR